mgnify:CR=1 FL=1
MSPEFRRQLSRLLSTHWNIPFLNALQQEIGDDVFLAWLLQTFSFYSLPREELAICVKQQRSNDIAKMLIECGVNWAELVFKVRLVNFVLKMCFEMLSVCTMCYETAKLLSSMIHKILDLRIVLCPDNLFSKVQSIQQISNACKQLTVFKLPHKSSSVPLR